MATQQFVVGHGPKQQNVNVDNASAIGGGTQYAEGTTQATITGTAALAEGPTNVVKPLLVDASQHLQVDIAADSVGIGGGTQYTEGDIDTTITGNAMMMEVASDTLQPVQGTVAGGLLVNLGSNNDVTLATLPDTAAGDLAAINTAVSGTLTVSGTVTANLSATDNAVLDTIASPVATISATPLQRVAIFDASDSQITSFGGGTQYTEADTDSSITGTALMWEDAADTLRAVSAAKPLPVAEQGVVSVDATGQGDVPITLAGEAVVLGAGSAAIGKLGANSGVDIGDVTINNASIAVTSASALDVSAATVTVDSELTTDDLDTGVGTDTRAVVGLVGSASGGGELIPGSAANGLLVNLGSNNDVTVTGTVSATQSGTWNITNVSGTVSLPTGAATAANQTTIIGHVDGIEGLLTTIDTDTGNIATDTSTIAGDTTSIDGKLVTATTDDLDTGAGTDTVQVMGIAVPANGGHAVIPGDATNGLTVNLGTNNDVTLATLPDTGAGDLAAINSAVSGTLTVQVSDTSFAVADGNALGEGVLIQGDDGTDRKNINVDATTGDVQVDVTNTVTVSATQLDVDNLNPTDDIVAIGDGAATATIRNLAANDALNVAIVDGAGDQITSFGGGTQYTEDDAAAANPVGTTPILVRQDTPATLVSLDGDNVAQRATNYGAAFVQVLDSSGNFIDTFGGSGGTSSADDADFTAATTLGTPAMGVYESSPTSVTDGDMGIVGITSTRSLKVQETNSAAILADTANMDTNLGTIAGDTTSIDGKITACNTGAVVLAAGSAAFGKLSANSGVDIGDVDVTSVIPGTGATSLGKAEDAAHTTGDTGVMLLGVRTDAPNTARSGTDADYTPIAVTSTGVVQTIRADEDFAALANSGKVKKYYTAATPTDGIIWSPAAGKRWYVTDIFIGVSAASTVTLEDDLTGGDSAVWAMQLAANSGWSHSFETPLYSGEDAADLTITATAGTVYVTVTGYEI